MRGSRQVFWHQGLFLQPQHLQQADATHEAELARLAGLSRPYLWGVHKVGFNGESVAAGRIELTGGEFLFPEGGRAVVGDNCVVVPRSFKPDQVPAEGGLDVYVGVRARRTDGPNVTEVPSREAAQADPPLTTWCSVVQPHNLTDMQGSGPQGQVRLLEYVVRIFFADELDKADGYQLLAVASVVRDKESFALDDAFIPPPLTVRSHARLTELFDEVRDAVVTRCRQLEGYKNQSWSGGDALDGSYMGMLLALRTLTRQAARLSHLAGAPGLAPFDAYGALRELIGELSFFTGGIDALGETSDGQALVPDYDHTRAGACFVAAHALALRLVDNLTAGPEYVASFEWAEPYWTVEIPQHLFAEGNTFWILVTLPATTDTDVESMRDSLTRLAKVGPTRELSPLLARAVPGLPLEHVEGTPPGLPRRPNTLYFRMETESALWDSVSRTGSLSLYWHEAPADVKPQLAVLRG